MTAATEPLATRALGPDDAAAAVALSSEAGWNQTVADWRFMLAAGEAQGQVTAAGALVASALILPYDHIAWIGMVLTTARQRRRGLATANLRWAMDRCAARGLIAGLDATPAGRAVYAPLGFVDLWGLHRLRAARPALPDGEQGSSIRPMRGDDLAAVAALDGEAFGAGRNALVAYLRDGAPACAWVAEGTGGLAGFVLGRAGVATLHIGPLIARDAKTATALAARALGEGMPVSIDVPDAQAVFRQRLIEAGFAPLRPFTRMLRHAGAAPGTAGLTFAIAGPELG